MGKATVNSGVDFGLINQPEIGINCQYYDGCSWDSKGTRCRACAKSIQRMGTIEHDPWRRRYYEMKGRLDALMVEAALAYQEWKSADMPEMSPDEMYAYLMVKAEESTSTPLSEYYESPMQVHERLGQMGIMQSKKRDAGSSAEFWARCKSQDEYAATVAQRRQA